MVGEPALSKLSDFSFPALGDTGRRTAASYEVELTEHRITEVRLRAALAHFEHEFVAHIEERRCPFH